jgi:hypothetical protein
MLATPPEVPLLALMALAVLADPLLLVDVIAPISVMASPLPMVKQGPCHKLCVKYQSIIDVCRGGKANFS